MSCERAGMHGQKLGFYFWVRGLVGGWFGWLLGIVILYFFFMLFWRLLCLF